MPTNFVRYLLISLILNTALLTVLPVYSSQAKTTYGVVTCTPNVYYSPDGGYVDILRKANGWYYGGQVPPLTSSGYPTTNPGGNALDSFFTVLGYGPGIVRFNFYGKGIFDLSIGGPGVTYWDPPNNGIVPGTLKKTVDQNGVTTTTCQIEFNIPQPVFYFGNGDGGVPLNWLSLDNINPDQAANGNPDDFHLTLVGYPAWQDGGNNPLYTNEFLKAWSPFACFRFIDSMNTNGTEIEQRPIDWSDRSLPNVYGSGSGICGALS